MTETSDGSSASTSTEQTSWWGSWVEAAKQKSNETLEFMKRDIAEFTETIQQDTTSMVSSTAAALRDKLNVETGSSALEKAKEGISSILGSITDSLNGPNPEDDEEQVVIIQDSRPIILDRSQAEIYAIQTNPDTFCREPTGPPDLYEEWLMKFKLNDHQDELSDLMINRIEMRNLYSKLVPSAVSHDEFWNRYYYRLYKFKEAEERRAALMRRADQSNDNEISIDWDNVDENTSEKDDDDIETNVKETKDTKTSEVPNEEKLKEIKDKVDETVGESNATRDSPVPSNESNGTSSKESSVGEDWEKNFDSELSSDDKVDEEKNQTSEKILKEEKDVGDDWETWE